MSTETFVDSIVKETFARLGDSSDDAKKKAIVGQSGHRRGIEFASTHLTAVWLPSRNVIVFRDKAGRPVRILNVAETMRARGIAA